MVNYRSTQKNFRKVCWFLLAPLEQRQSRYAEGTGSNIDLSQMALGRKKSLITKNNLDKIKKAAKKKCTTKNRHLKAIYSSRPIE